MREQNSGRLGRQEAAAAAGGVAIVIPAFDEAATIETIVRACLALPGRPRVLVVDDGSTDETAVLAAEAGAELLPQATNRGKGDSLRRGMRAALAGGARWIVTLDADGQHRPEDVPRLLAAAAAWPGRLVIGARCSAGAGPVPRARRIANRVADFWISWAARQKVPDSQSGFRVYPAALAALLVQGGGQAERFAFESEALIEAGRGGFGFVAVPIPAIYSPALRPSHFRPVADIARIVRMVAGRLLARGMDPVGLWQSLRRPPSQ
ncbi:MAG: glycosyltransferase family 2 protein [Rhodospirillales bacterium]|jgi:glycosyltransferase involved in cell wall biosynthesis|nr:glycosyltransferase family 2 protein [Rhodospirillales bacterium]